MKCGTIILAAGMGKRMKSELPKVIHKVAGREMVTYPVEASLSIGASPIAVIIGHKGELIEEVLKDKDVSFATQKEQLGTAHAVLQAEDIFKDFSGIIIILCGDVPLLTADFLEKIRNHHIKTGSTVTAVSMLVDNPHGYGRMVADKSGDKLEIVEEKDATDEQRKINEVNSGIYVVEKGFLFAAIPQISNKNKQKEYYLTDIVKIACNKGEKVSMFCEKDADMLMGINSIENLAKAEESYQERQNRQSGAIKHL